MSTPTIAYVKEALSTAVDDVLKKKSYVSMDDEMDALLDASELAEFYGIVSEEFEIEDPSLFESATSFRELAALILGEIS